MRRSVSCEKWPTAHFVLIFLPPPLCIMCVLWFFVHSDFPPAIYDAKLSQVVQTELCEVELVPGVW